MLKPQTFLTASLDPYAQRITMGVSYLGGMLMLPLLFAYLSNLRWDGLLITTVFALSLAAVLVLAYAAAPTAYLIDDQHLTIRRRWWRSLKIPLKQVSGVSLATTLSDIPRSGLRFAFNPGLFGYQGPFRLQPYGRVFFLATSREHLVAVARGVTPPLIISPARPRAFIEALNEQRLKAQQPAS
ncbi:MAG: hypothetical protein HC837_14275 [Chloroflexaceae bacterium]|nr:hypothetical protein [Chloroflexaceae bacterium]